MRGMKKSEFTKILSSSELTCEGPKPYTVSGSAGTFAMLLGAQRL